MKPLHKLLLIALKNALIVVAAFTLYEIIEELKAMWQKKYPENLDMHKHYGRFVHLVSVFVADFTIGVSIYYLFNVIH